jgi:hypothetical protein
LKGKRRKQATKALKPKIPPIGGNILRKKELKGIKNIVATIICFFEKTLLLLIPINVLPNMIGKYS